MNQQHQDFELHGIVMSQVREIIPGLFIGNDVSAGPNGRHPLNGHQRLFRKEGGGFRGYVIPHSTKARGKCVRLDLWNDDYSVKVRRLFKTPAGAVRAMERIAKQLFTA